MDTVKRLCIKKLPKVLVIQLKRFDYDWERYVPVALNSGEGFSTDRDGCSFQALRLKPTYTSLHMPLFSLVLMADLADAADLMDVMDKVFLADLADVADAADFRDAEDTVVFAPVTDDADGCLAVVNFVEEVDAID